MKQKTIKAWGVIELFGFYTPINWKCAMSIFEKEELAKAAVDYLTKKAPHLTGRVVPVEIRILPSKPLRKSAIPRGAKKK